MNMVSSPCYRITSRVVDHILDVQLIIQLQLLLSYQLHFRCFSFRLWGTLPDSISQHLIMFLPLPAQIRRFVVFLPEP